MTELTEYLIELGKMLGIDTDTEGCVNPNLALSARIVLAIDELERPLQWKSVADGLPDAKQNAEAEKLAKLEALFNSAKGFILSAVGDSEEDDDRRLTILATEDGSEFFLYDDSLRVKASGKTPLEAIYAYLEQAEGGEE